MTLCIESGCNLCCDGTLYGAVILEADEWPALNDLIPAIQLCDPTDSSTGQIMFRQPCSLAGRDGCAGYARRPTICRNYACKLLLKYEDGGISLTDATALVNNAVALREKLLPQLVAFMPESGSLAFIELANLALTRISCMDKTEITALPIQLRLDLPLMRLLLAKNFDSKITEFTYRLEHDDGSAAGIAVPRMHLDTEYGDATG